MDSQGRNDKRRNIFNYMMFELSLFGRHNSIKWFLEEFEQRMQQEGLGYTKADETYAEELLLPLAEECRREMEKAAKQKAKEDKIMKKFVGFLLPRKNWDDMDWLYNLLEDHNRKEFDFFLVEARTPDVARDLIVDQVFKKAMKKGGVEFVVEYAFEGLGCLEMEDDEILEYLGKKDGNTALAFFEKYTFDVFQEDKIGFCDGFGAEDQEKFYGFSQENLRKLFKLRRKGDILVARISHELVEKTGEKQHED